MLDLWLVVAGGLCIAIAASSRLYARVPLSPPLVALTVGVLAGPAGLGILQLPGTPQEVLAPASRLTLAVALMAIALRYPLRDVWRRTGDLGWLLLAVMPVMALTVALAGSALLGLGVGAAAVLGACLAPTDPVLASSVVTGDLARRDLPAKLRQALSLESGANDGLALPMVLLATTTYLGTSRANAVLEAVWSVAGAVLLGAVLGWATGRLLVFAERHHDVDTSMSILFSLVLSFATLGAANLLRTGDLLAVFVTGLAFNASTPASEREAEERIDEGVNSYLILPVFVLFGVSLPWDAWGELGWRGVAFAVVVLLARRLPWTLLLRQPLGLDVPGATWLGWFGPIGAAALFYLAHLEQLGAWHEGIWAAGTLAVAASTLAHGTTGALGRRWYAATGTGRHRAGT